MPQFGSSRGGRGARACNLPAGSELGPFPVRSRVRGERGLLPGSSQSARAPWRPELPEGAGRAKEWRGRASHPGPRAGGPGSSEVILSKIDQGVPAPTSLRLLGRHCPLAPSPRVASGLLQGRVLASQARWPRLPAGPLFARPLQDPGDQPRTCISESSRAPLLAPDARGAGPRRASVQGGWTR